MKITINFELATENIKAQKYFQNYPLCNLWLKSQD